MFFSCLSPLSAAIPPLNRRYRPATDVPGFTIAQWAQALKFHCASAIGPPRRPTSFATLFFRVSFFLLLGRHSSFQVLLSLPALISPCRLALPLFSKKFAALLCVWFLARSIGVGSMGFS